MKSIYLLICMLAFSVGFARQNPTPATPKTLNEQYRALSADCDLVGGFRMMKLYKMDQFWKTIQDSVTSKNVGLANSIAVTAQQKSEINQLKTILAKSESEKAALTLKVDNILVFGKPYSKSGFITFSTSMIVGLLTLIVVLVLMYRMTSRGAHELRKLNEELYKEFDDYKHKAIEKEIKISRELQNYRNRMSELKSA